MEPGLVDDGADPGQGAVPVVGHFVAKQGHRSGIGVREPQEHPDEGGFAGSVGTEVPERTSTGDQQLDPVHGDVVLEAFGQAVGLDGPLAFCSIRRGAFVQGDRGHVLSFI